MKVVLNMKGFAALRSDPAMMAELNRLAEEIATKAGDGYEAKPAGVTGGRGRGRAAVVTMTPQARVQNAKHNVLLRALGGQGMVTYTSKAGKTSLITQAQYDNYTRRKK